jgi:hypothetical protein
MEATCSSETSLDFQQTWHYVTKDKTISQNVNNFPTIRKTSQLSSELKDLWGGSEVPIYVLELGLRIETEVETLFDKRRERDAKFYAP